MVVHIEPATTPAEPPTGEPITMTATPAKSVAKKSVAKKAAAKPAQVETAEDIVADAETEATETQTAAEKARIMPTAVFEVFDPSDIPANPKRQVREGFGTSKWVGTLTKVQNEAQPNTLAKVFEYNGPTGGRLAQKNLEDKVAEGNSPFPTIDGEVWFTLVRRYDVDVNGKAERRSGIWIGHGEVDGVLAGVDGIVLMVKSDDVDTEGEGDGDPYVDGDDTEDTTSE